MDELRGHETEQESETGHVAYIKRLTLSDACTSKQIKLPRAAAERFIAPLADREGCQLELVDEGGRGWSFACTRYNCQYALSKIGPFAQAHSLAQDDFLIFHLDSDSALRVAIRKSLPSTLRNGLHVPLPLPGAVTSRQPRRGSQASVPKPPAQEASQAASCQDPAGTSAEAVHCQPAEATQVSRTSTPREPRDGQHQHAPSTASLPEALPGRMPLRPLSVQQLQLQQLDRTQAVGGKRRGAAGKALHVLATANSSPMMAPPAAVGTAYVEKGKPAATNLSGRAIRCREEAPATSKESLGASKRKLSSAVQAPQQQIGAMAGGGRHDPSTSAGREVGRNITHLSNIPMNMRAVSTGKAERLVGGGAAAGGSQVQKQVPHDVHRGPAAGAPALFGLIAPHSFPYGRQAAPISAPRQDVDTAAAAPSSARSSLLAGTPPCMAPMQQQSCISEPGQRWERRRSRDMHCPERFHASGAGHKRDLQGSPGDSEEDGAAAAEALTMLAAGFAPCCDPLVSSFTANKRRALDVPHREGVQHLPVRSSQPAGAHVGHNYGSETMREQPRGQPLDTAHRESFRGLGNAGAPSPRHPQARASETGLASREGHSELPNMMIWQQQQQALLQQQHRQQAVPHVPQQQQAISHVPQQQQPLQMQQRKQQRQANSHVQEQPQANSQMQQQPQSNLLAQQISTMSGWSPAWPAGGKWSTSSPAGPQLLSETAGGPSSATHPFHWQQLTGIFPTAQNGAGPAPGSSSGSSQVPPMSLLTQLGRELTGDIVFCKSLTEAELQRGEVVLSALLLEETGILAPASGGAIGSSESVLLDGTLSSQVGGPSGAGKSSLVLARYQRMELVDRQGDCWSCVLRPQEDVRGAHLGLPSAAATAASADARAPVLAAAPTAQGGFFHLVGLAGFLASQGACAGDLLRVGQGVIQEGQHPTYKVSLLRGSDLEQMAAALGPLR